MVADWRATSGRTSHWRSRRFREHLAVSSSSKAASCQLAMADTVAKGASRYLDDERGTLLSHVMDSREAETGDLQGAPEIELPLIHDPGDNGQGIVAKDRHRKLLARKVPAKLGARTFRGDDSSWHVPSGHLREVPHIRCGPVRIPAAGDHHYPAHDRDPPHQSRRGRADDMKPHYLPNIPTCVLWTIPNRRARGGRTLSTPVGQAMVQLLCPQAGAGPAADDRQTGARHPGGQFHGTRASASHISSILEWHFTVHCWNGRDARFEAWRQSEERLMSDLTGDGGVPLIFAWLSCCLSLCPR